MRLFTAIELDDRTKDALAGAADALRACSVHGNFTLRDNFHITLVFLGETDNAAAVRRAMHSVSVSPFTLQIGGSGVFHRGGKDLYWTGVRQNASLQQVYSELFDALRANGFRLEQRRYTPHLTLGREVVLRQGVATIPAECGPELDVKVNTITLMRSDRIQGKLVYTPIYRVKLKEN